MDKLELIVVLVISLFTLFIPLIIYLFVRSGDRCRKCRKKVLIPLSSPVARAALETSVARVQPKDVPLVTPVRNPPANWNSDGTNQAAKTLGTWVGHHPMWTIVLMLLCVGWLSRALLTEPFKPVQQEGSMISGANQPKEMVVPDIPPPKFRIFRARRDEIISYIVAPETTDEQLKRLLWLFREKVRGGRFKEIGIAQPTAKQWDVYGYKSGMLVVYRGDRCASEPYVSLKEAEAGHLGPCGYGDHDDAGYQWGINADPDKDSGDIKDKNGKTVIVFDYKDNWRP
jgi:hypothetical protein